MEQEILFRGKSINSNEWIESMTVAKGTIKRKSDCVYLSIGDDAWRGVKPETVGMFSTIYDKKGMRIFDGDLFKLGAEKGVFEVRFEHGCFLAYKKGKQFGLVGELQICFIDVVGNIFDTPELLAAAN